MSEDAPTIEELRTAMLAAAGQSAAATQDLIEHHRDTCDQEQMSRFPNETCELLADALGAAVRVEIAGLDRAIAETEQLYAEADRHTETIREHRAHYNQLLGAVTRFNEGWAG